MLLVAKIVVNVYTFFLFFFRIPWVILTIAKHLITSYVLLARNIQHISYKTKTFFASSNVFFKPYFCVFFFLIFFYRLFQLKYANTKKAYGISITGYQVFDLLTGQLIKRDKHYGRNLTKETVPNGKSENFVALFIDE